jgi:hypothetical protein
MSSEMVEIEMIKLETIKLLQQFYQIKDEAVDKLPPKIPKEEWRAENKFGFLMGIMKYGEESHCRELHELLVILIQDIHDYDELQLVSVILCNSSMYYYELYKVYAISQQHV